MMSVIVPNGYKQTKVGVIPEDWDVVKLGEVAKTTAGGTPSTQNTSYWGGNIKWMSSGELNYKIVYDTEGRITEEGLNNSSTKIIPENCILIGLAGQGKTRGTVAINKIELCTNQSIAAILPNENKFAYKYLYYNLDNRYDELRRLSTGEGGRGGLNLQIINGLKIPLPSLKEQEKIAQFLTIWDDAISKEKALIKAKKELKKGLMQKLLSGEVRFDEFDGEWEEVRFNTVFERITRKNTVNDINVLTISAQYGLINQEEFFNKSVASKDLSGYILLKNGEFAYNKSYSNGYPMGAVKRLNRYEQSVLSSLYIYFAIKNGDSNFYEHYFEAGFLNKEIYKIAQEGARNHGLLNMSVIEFFNDMHILKPPLAEQQKIAEVLTLVDKEISLLKN